MMATAVLVLLAAYIALSAWLGLRADRRFSRHPRLPMQWSLDGRPTWYAPRRLALIAFPILSGAGLLVIAAMSVVTAMAPATMTASPGLLLPFGLGILGIGLFAVYLRMVALWDRANP